MRNFAILTLVALAFTFTGLLASDERSEPTGMDTGARPQGSSSRAGNSPTQAAVADDAASDCRAGVALYRSVFTDAVKDRVPHKRFVVLGPETPEVIFFTELVGAAGRQITHRWLHDDAEVEAFSFDIASERSESWSARSVGQLRPGVLRVEVLDGECLIGQESVQIAATSQLDPADRTGWMRPKQALETLLARQAGEPEEVVPARRAIDGRDSNGDTRLTAAIRRRDQSEAMKLIRTHDMDTVPDSRSLSSEDYERYRQMADPLLPDRDGVSPIDLAHRMGQTEIVEALIESAVTPSKSRRRRRSPPDRGMWDDTVIRSLGAGGGAELRFADGDTALHRAVRLGNERAVITLLQLGKKTLIHPTKIPELVYAYDASGRRPLDIARDEGFYGIERFLEMAIKKHQPKWALHRATFAASMNGDEPGECRKVGFEDESQLFFFAEIAEMKSRRVSHEWLFKGANEKAFRTVHASTFDVPSEMFKTQSQRPFTPEDVGSWEVRILDDQGEVLGSRRLRFLELTPSIIKNRAQYIGTEGCNLGGSAMFALVDAHAPISKIQYLVDKGATLKPRSHIQQNLFFKAIHGGNISLTRWFLDRGVDIDAHVKDGRMPLAIAAEAGDVPMVLFLIAKGADVNRQRFRGKLTALQVAATELDVGVARVLLANGADPNIPSDGGFTALHRAASRCAAELSVVLLEHGADPLAQSNQGETPRKAAIQCRASDTWQPDLPGLAPLLARGAEDPPNVDRLALESPDQSRLSAR